MSIERLAAAAGVVLLLCVTGRNTAHAQQIVAEMTLAGAQALDRLRGKPEE